MRRGAVIGAWIVAASVVALGVRADVASASTLGHVTLPIGGLFDFLNPIKDVAELIGKVVGKLFGALAQALMPDFLKRATVHTLEGLVALPQLGDQRAWRNVGALRAGTTAIAWALLPLPFTLAATRYLIGTFTDGPNPITAVTRLVGAAFGLVLYPWAAGQALVAVNVLTHSLLSLPAVGNGLQRAVQVLFGAAIIAGLATPFLAVLALVAIVLATLLFALKIAVLMIAALLYVAGPLVIALAPLQETSHLYRAWLFAFIALAMIPVGWCLIFAVAGALTLDATSGGVSAGLIGKDVTAALAALLSFAIAVLWPKVLISHALQVAAGMGIRVRGGAGASMGRAPVAGRAQAAVRQLRDGALTVGRGVGRAMGALGAPAGGVAGWAGRLMARTPPVAVAAAVAGGATSALGARVAGIRSRAAAGEGGRMTRAAAELAAIPGELRAQRASADGVAEAPAGAPRSAGARSHDQSAPPAAGAPPAPDRRGSSPRTAAGGSATGSARGSLSPEKRAVLGRLPRDLPPRVREAVLRAQPGQAAAAATKAASRAGAPLSAQTQRAVFAAGGAAAARTPGAEVRPSRPAPPRPSSRPGSTPSTRPAPRLSAPRPERPGPRPAPAGRRSRKPRGRRA